MAKKPDEQPDMKQIEKRVKDAKVVEKQLDRCHKELCSIAEDVKELDKKFS